MRGRLVPRTVYVLGMYHERFLVAAQRVLDGDDTIRAANGLEGILVDDYPGDERFDDLVECWRSTGQAKALRTPRHNRSARSSGGPSPPSIEGASRNALTCRDEGC
jgi:hypothetical protein